MQRNEDGPLAGLSVVVKDVIDVAGAVTGGGNPDWADAHQPARQNAAAVAALTAAGASLVAKGQCAELAFSLSGDNVHFGMPSNPVGAGPGSRWLHQRPRLSGGGRPLRRRPRHRHARLDPRARLLLRRLRLSPHARPDPHRRGHAACAEIRHRRPARQRTGPAPQCRRGTPWRDRRRPSPLPAADLAAAVRRRRGQGRGGREGGRGRAGRPAGRGAFGDAAPRRRPFARGSDVRLQRPPGRPGLAKLRGLGRERQPLTGAGHRRPARARRRVRP